MLLCTSRKPESICIKNGVHSQPFTSSEYFVWLSNQTEVHVSKRKLKSVGNSLHNTKTTRNVLNIILWRLLNFVWSRILSLRKSFVFQFKQAMITLRGMAEHRGEILVSLRTMLRHLAFLCFTLLCS